MMRHKQPFIRFLYPSDARDLYAMSKQSKQGLTNLPKTRSDCEVICNVGIEKSVSHIYFGLDNGCGRIVGISAIKLRTGICRLNYFYKLRKDRGYPYVSLITERHDGNELGSLFLTPAYRGRGFSRLLSLSRFLFMRLNPSKFTGKIVAEMRGYFYSNNRSPVYEGLAKQFLNMSFKRAEAASMNDAMFLETNFPEHPIYLNLLPNNVSQYFGRVHPYTEPAKTLLVQQGFYPTDRFDIFDGGPIYECQLDSIIAFKDSIICNSKNLNNYIQCNKRYIISTASVDNFKAIIKAPDMSIHDVQSFFDGYTKLICVDEACHV